MRSFGLSVQGRSSNEILLHMRFTILKKLILPQPSMQIRRIYRTNCSSVKKFTEDWPPVESQRIEPLLLFLESSATLPLHGISTQTLFPAQLLLLPRILKFIVVVLRILPSHTVNTVRNHTSFFVGIYFWTVLTS